MTLRNLLQIILLAAALVVPSGLRAQIIEYPNPGMQWYGNSIAVDPWIGPKFGIMIPGTFPTFGNANMFPMAIGGQKGPPGFPLADNASWHNMSMYAGALAWGNTTRLLVLTHAKAKNKKEGGDPLVGKGPASLSFWQWVKIGQASLATYSKIRNIQRALMSGRLEINLWKLAPKMAFINESTDNANVIFLALAPTNQSSFDGVKTVFSRNSLKGFHISGELKDLLPSLAVKQSFFDLVAHTANYGLVPGETPEPGRQANATSDIHLVVHHNLHEVMTSLSLLRRDLAGMADDEIDWDGEHKEKAAKFRMGPAYMSREIKRIMDRRADAFSTAAGEVERSLGLLSPEAKEAFGAFKGSFRDADRLQRRTLDDVSQRRAMDWWGVKQVSATLSNITVPLENEGYLEGVERVEGLLRDYMSMDALTKQIPATVHQDGTWPSRFRTDANGNRIPIDAEGNDIPSEPLHIVDDHEKIQLALATADAWVNRLIRDEMRALRQIYTVSAQMEGQKRLAPHIAKTLASLQAGAKRLDRLQKQLANVEASREDMKKFIKPADFNRDMKKFDTRPQ